MSGEQQPASEVAKAWDAVTDWAASAAEATGDAIAEAAEATGDAIAEAAEATGEFLGDAMQIYGEAQIRNDEAQQAFAMKTAEDFKQAAQATGEAIKDGMETYGEARLRGAQYRAEAARQQAEAIKYGGTTGIDAGVIAAGTVVIAAVKGLPGVEFCLRAVMEDPGGKPGDGEYMGKGCESNCEGCIETSPCAACTSKQMPAEGVKPAGCANCPRQFPKIIYTNGINTSRDAACATLHKIADSRCAEVIGIYNATDGTMADFVNANGSIEGRRDDPAAMTLSETIRDFAERGEHVTLYAHSEGGLNSIVGLRDAYDKMDDKYNTAYADAAMRNIAVYSFGTAQTGWPDGPHYEQYTNWSDLVPHVIGEVQAISGESPEWLQKLTKADLPWWNETSMRNLRTPKPEPVPHDFNEPYLNFIDAHSMDNVYLDKLNSLDPIQKGPDGSCCG